MTDTRYENLLKIMSANRLDVLALTPGPSLFYLTGLDFHVMERPIVLLLAPPNKPTLVLPQLEIIKAGLSKLPLAVITYGDNPAAWKTSFKEAVDKLGINGKTIGLEPTRMRYLEYDFLHRAAPKSEFLPAEHILGELRISKKSDEIEAMKKAVWIAQEALKATIPFMKSGRTEREIASHLTLKMLELGSEGFPSIPIVSSGPNSANPHATPSDRPLQPGDMIVIDWGATYHGYYSDLTRVFAVDPVDPEFEKIAQIVLDANQAAIAASKPGISIGMIDAAARQVIEKAGYAERFTHRTGHGLGLEVHEAPYVFLENEQTTLPGMSFTIEPGIYLPGRGGVRIEDNVIISDEGAIVLSDMPRDLVHLT